MQMLGVLVRVLRVFSGVHDLWHKGVAEESHGEQKKTVGEGERQRTLEGIYNFPSLPKVPCPSLSSGVRHCRSALSIRVPAVIKVERDASPVISIFSSKPIFASCVSYCDSSIALPVVCVGGILIVVYNTCIVCADYSRCVRFFLARKWAKLLFLNLSFISLFFFVQQQWP